MVGAVDLAEFARKQLEQLAQGSVGRMPEETGQVDIVSLAAPLADSNQLHQGNVERIGQRTVLGFVQPAQAAIGIVQKLHLELSQPALNASFAQAQVVWSADSGEGAGQQLRPEGTRREKVQVIGSAVS